MQLTVIKYFFMFICSFYHYHKLLNHNTSKKERLSASLVSVILLLPFYYIHTYAPVFFVIAEVITLFCLCHFTFKTPFGLSFITSLISYGFSFFAFTLSMFPATIICVISFSSFLDTALLEVLSQLLTGILQLVLSHFMYRINRLKNGMPFLIEKSSNDPGIAIGVIILLSTTFLGYKADTPVVFIIALFIAISGIVLIIWWRSRLTQTYMSAVKNRELDSLKKELDQLKSENQNLAKIIHKDNKLIPAMDMSVRTLLQSYPNDDTANHLLTELEHLSTERKGTLSTYENTNKTFAPTKIIRIDSLIRYMHQKCITFNINFDFATNCNFHSLTQYSITEDELTTLMADLIENAIIATKDMDYRNILVTLNKENEHYCLNVFDSGTHFDKNVIKNMGNIPTTTHADTGGSGIGLITVFEIIRKHNANFCLDENPDSSVYTKKITITFPLSEQPTLHRTY